MGTMKPRDRTWGETSRMRREKDTRIQPEAAVRRKPQRPRSRRTPEVAVTSLSSSPPSSSSSPRFVETTSHAAPSPVRDRPPTAHLQHNHAGNMQTRAAARLTGVLRMPWRWYQQLASIATPTHASSSPFSKQLGIFWPPTPIARSTSWPSIPRTTLAAQ